MVANRGTEHTLDARLLLLCVVEQLVCILEKKFRLPGVCLTWVSLAQLISLSSLSSSPSFSLSLSPSEVAAADGAGVGTMRRRTCDAAFFELYAPLLF